MAGMIGLGVISVWLVGAAKRNGLVVDVIRSCCSCVDPEVEGCVVTSLSVGVGAGVKRNLGGMNSGLESGLGRGLNDKRGGNLSGRLDGLSCLVSSVSD